MRTFHILSVLFILVYTRGAMERLGLPELATKVLTELPIAVLVCHTVIRSRSHRAPGWVFVALFAAWTILSGISSGDPLYRSLLYFRMLAYAYVVFWAVWNAHLTGREILHLNKIILSLWVLQIVAALFEILVLGQRIEAHAGIMAAGSGASATVFPLFAMCYVMAIYCYYKRSLWWVFLALAFGVVGYASGKRAVYFLMPALYACIIVWYCLRAKSFESFRKMIPAIAMFALAIPVLLFGIARTKQISSGSKDTGAIEAMAYATYTAVDYTFAQGEGGVSTGRTRTSLNVLQRLLGIEGKQFFFGRGPASLLHAGKKRAKGALGVDYGITGWAKDTVSIGWPGMIFQLGLYVYLWLKLSRQRAAMTNGYAKAIHFGTHLAFVVFVFVYFFYCDTFTLSGWFTFVHFYFLALVLSPNH